VKLLPYHTVTLRTHVPFPLVVQRLTAQIEPSKMMRWGFSQNHAPYQGSISDASFRIHRIINYRNSALPIIRGRFESLSNETLIHITLSVHPFVAGFLGFWFFNWYGVSIPMWLMGILPNEVALLVLGAPLIFLGLLLWAFWYEANRSQRELEQIIEGSYLPSLDREANTRFKKFQAVCLLLGVGVMVAQLGSVMFFAPSHLQTPLVPLVDCSQQPIPSPYCSLKRVRILTGHSTITAIALSQDGRTLVSGGADKALKVWNLETGRVEKTFQSDSGQIIDVAIAPNVKTAVTASGDRMVRIWDLTANHSPLMLAGHSSELRFVRITPDGKTIISGGLGEIKLWDLATGTLKATLPIVQQTETKLGPLTIENGPSGFVPQAIGTDGKTAIVDISGGDITVWNLATNQQQAVLKEKWDAFAGYFMSAAISPDGKRAALQYSNSSHKFETRLKVWDLTRGTVIARGTTSFSSTTFIDVPLALSRDRIFGMDAGQLKVWNLQTAALEIALKAEWMGSLVVSPDGKFLAGVSGDPSFKNTTIQIFQRL